MNSSSSPRFRRKRPIENLFKNDVARLLDFFIFNKLFSYSRKEIHELTKIQSHDLNPALNFLLKNGLIIAENIGSSKAFILNQNSAVSQSLIGFIDICIATEIAKNIQSSSVLQVQNKS